MSPISKKASDITKAKIDQKDLDEFKALYPKNPQIQCITLDQVKMNTPQANGNWNEPLPDRIQVQFIRAQAHHSGISDCKKAIGYVVFDCLCLALGALRLRSHANSAIILSIGGSITPIASKLEAEIPKMVAREASRLDMARVVFDVLETIYSHGILGSVFCAFTKDMTRWNAMLYGITGTATLFNAISTDGERFIADVAARLKTFGYLVSDSVKVALACRN